MQAAESSKTANKDHRYTSEAVKRVEQVRLGSAAAREDRHGSCGTTSKDMDARSPHNASTNSSVGIVANNTPNNLYGRWPAGSTSNATLQNTGSDGSWTSGRQTVVFQGRTRSSSLQKHVVVFNDTQPPTGTLHNCGPRPFPRVRREVWESGSPQRCAAMLQRSSTSSVSLATPRRQMSVALYARHPQPAGPETVRRLMPENEMDGGNSRTTCPHISDGPERQTYGRTVTRVRASAQNGGTGVMPRGGFAWGGTVIGGHHQKRGKTAREAKIASQRLRRGRKYRVHGSPAVSSKLRRMLRLRSLSATDNCPGKILYHRVYMVLGLLHHRGGGDFVQNGFVCLRACDVTHETNALISEAATFIWDRDRVSPELTMPPVYRTATGAGVTPQGEPWMGGGMLLGKELETPNAGTLGIDTGVTPGSSGGGQRSRRGLAAATSAAFSWLTPSDGSSAHKRECCRPSSPMTVFTIGVRIALKPSTPIEERKCIAYVRDYLASQLATYPFLRHYVLITKFKKNRFFWPFLHRWRQPPPFSVIGTGQYSAVVNASTQVDGLTPLEVCIMHPPKRSSFGKSKSTTGAFSLLTGVAGPLRSFMWKNPRRSR